MTAKVTVRKKIATADNKEFVCSNSGYTVKFDFDEEWDEHSLKTARFVWNGKYEEVVFEGDTCSVPVIDKADSLVVGVYAGNLRTTTPALFKCKRSVLSGSPEHAEPTEDVYNQLVSLCNEAVSIAISVEERANSGEFNGRDGKDGAKGEEGYTPQREIDYWTPEDRASIVTEVLEALPKAEEAMF